MAIGRKKSKTKKRSDAARQSARPVARPSGGGSHIARGMVLDGDCEADGPLRVDGHVTGNVRAPGLVVGPGGRVDGDVTGPAGNGSDPATVIEGRVGGTVRARRVEIGPDGSVGSGLNAHEAVVHGNVKGRIETEHRLRLEKTANVEGDVTARRLGLAEGGRVSGTIRIGEPRRGGGG
ncbi:MAG: bactofilin family protein [Gemmatimonadota bacterium]